VDTLIIGLGNPILGDDAAGWNVIEQLLRQAPGGGYPGVEVDCLCLGGLALMERILGYSRVILVDAVQTGNPPGAVHNWRLEEMPNPAGRHLFSAHDTQLQTALQMAESCGAQIPTEIIVIGIEAQPVYEFSEVLSLEVSNAIPQAVALVLQLIQPLETSPRARVSMPV